MTDANDEFEDDLGPLDDDPDAETGGDRETRETAMWLHLSQLASLVVPLAGVVVPIVIWQIKKDELPGIDIHGKHAVNWIISYVIYMAASLILCLVLIGIVTLILFAILGIVFPIMAGLKAKDGVVWRYPMSFRFIK